MKHDFNVSGYANTISKFFNENWDTSVSVVTSTCCSTGVTVRVPAGKESKTFTPALRPLSGWWELNLLG
jgi:hypothetical protein